MGPAQKNSGASVNLLVIDASLDKRIATELNAREREAIALSEMGLHDAKDPELLPDLASQFAERRWVLVTADDAMPVDHADLIAEIGATIATIDPSRPAEFGVAAWGRDVVHRWAHVMQAQATGTTRRYAENSHRAWRQRKRRTRRR